MLPVSGISGLQQKIRTDAIGYYRTITEYLEPMLRYWVPVLQDYNRILEPMLLGIAGL
jgi:hypothetical protein